jgi:hypothetical protein
MSPFVVALMFSAGAGAWVYSKMSHRIGEGNGRQAVIGTGVFTLVLFIIIYITLRTFFN